MKFRGIVKRQLLLVLLLTVLTGGTAHPFEWSSPEVVNVWADSDAETDSRPAIAADSNGKLHVVWRYQDADSFDYDLFYSTNVSGSWSEPTMISHVSPNRLDTSAHHCS